MVFRLRTYASTGSLEADGSLTNKQNVWIEANAGYAVERIPQQAGSPEC
jgi:hypothetical protein